MVKIKKPIIISGISLILFLLLLTTLNTTVIKNLDTKINTFMPTIETSNLITISKIIGTLIDPDYMLPIGLVLGAIIWFFYSKKESMFLCTSMILMGVLTIIVKTLVKVPRPANSLIENSFQSFPSGHVAITIVLFGILSYWLIKKYNSMTTKIITISITTLLTLIVGFSRLYLNAHWFSDILGGIFLGTFILTLCISLRIKIENLESKLFN